MQPTWVNIIIMAYSRPNSLNRLLKSLKRSLDGSKKAIHVTVSLDGGFHMDNESIINNFFWSHGPLEIVKMEENMGVDAHFLRCISSCQNQPLNIILEDDDFIGNGLADLIDYYSTVSEKCAACSLHSYKYNPNTDLPFVPLRNGNSFYAIQRTSSRGLMLTSNQAKNFITWKSGFNAATYRPNFPPYLKKYTDKVWETLFAKYLIETHQYTLFPYESVVTVFGDKGVHFKSTYDRFEAQTTLNLINAQTHKNQEPMVKYDAWLELDTSCIRHYCSTLSEYQFELDLHGTKKSFAASHVVTSKSVKNSILSFGMDLKPLELNVIYNNPGEELHLTLREDVCDDTFWQKLKRKQLLRLYHGHRHSFIELIYNLLHRFLSNMKFKVGLNK